MVLTSKRNASIVGSGHIILNIPITTAIRFHSVICITIVGGAQDILGIFQEAREFQLLNIRQALGVLFIATTNTKATEHMVHATLFDPTVGAVFETNFADPVRIHHVLPIWPELFGMPIAVVGVTVTVCDLKWIFGLQVLESVGQLIETSEIKAIGIQI